MSTQRKEKEIKGIFVVVIALFLVFLLIPILRLFAKSFEAQGGISLANYGEVLTSHGFMSAFAHSLIISSVSAVLTTLLAFILAYTINYTNIPKAYKGFIRKAAVADKEEGLPVDYVDPTEGNYSLTESVAVVDKGDDSKDLAMEMAECIITKGRAKLQEYYPLPIYEGETADSAYMSANPKVYPEPLTVDLLEKHQQISEKAKELAGK